MRSAISDHNSFEIGGIQLSRFHLEDVHKCIGADCNKVRNVGVFAVERLVGCLVLEHPCGAAILDMGDRACRLAPEFFRETCVGKDRANSFANHPVCRFCNAVLFGCIGRCFFVVNPCFPTEFRHLFPVLATAVCSDRLDASAILLENIAEFEEAFSDSLGCLCLEHKQEYHSRGVVDEREEISRFAERYCIDPPAYVAVDEIAGVLSSSHWRVAEIASLRAGDASFAVVAVSFLWERLRIDRHAVDQFFDFAEVPWPQMGETTMPVVVREQLWLSRLRWLAPDCSERVFFAAHRLEAQKLAVGNCFRHDHAAEEDIRPFGRVHTDFESFSKQNIAGEQVRIHSRYVQHLVQGHLHACAVLAFNRDMDAPNADAMELSLRHVDFNRFIEGCEVDQDVFVRREVFRRA